MCGIFHFQFCLIFIKPYIFVQQKSWETQREETQRNTWETQREAMHNFAPRPLIFNLQQKV